MKGRKINSLSYRMKSKPSWKRTRTWKAKTWALRCNLRRLWNRAQTWFLGVKPVLSNRALWRSRTISWEQPMTSSGRSNRTSKGWKKYDVNAFLNIIKKAHWLCSFGHLTEAVMCHFRKLAVSCYLSLFLWIMHIFCFQIFCSAFWEIYEIRCLLFL